MAHTAVRTFTGQPQLPCLPHNNLEPLEAFVAAQGSPRGVARRLEPLEFAHIADVRGSGAGLGRGSDPQWPGRGLAGWPRGLARTAYVVDELLCGSKEVAFFLLLDARAATVRAARPTPGHLFEIKEVYTNALENTTKSTSQ